MCRILRVLEGSGRQNQLYFTCLEGSGRLNVSYSTCLEAQNVDKFFTFVRFWRGVGRRGPPFDMRLACLGVPCFFEGAATFLPRRVDFF